MKRILGLGLLLALFSLPLLAGTKSSHAFLIPADARVGDAQLPEGRYNVSWSQKTGEQVQLTIKAQDSKKTVTVPARVVTNSEDVFAVETTVVNGATVVKEFHTPTATYIIESPTNAGK